MTFNGNDFFELEKPKPANFDEQFKTDLEKEFNKKVDEALDKQWKTTKANWAKDLQAMVDQNILTPADKNEL